MTHVAIELPEEIASRLGEAGDLARVVLEALAAQGYRSGKLTHAEVQRMMGLTSRWETDSFLKQAGAYLDYTEADLEHDLTVSR
jgi:acyl-CoA hydrolase